MAKRRCVVLGLDGVPLEAINRIVEHGAMPFTRTLLQRSFHGELLVDLPFTLSSWSSISTGCGPAKHGVFDCLYPQPWSEPKLVTREMVERPTMCEIAAMNGLRAVTISVPMTCPPVVTSRHIVVSDWTYPKLRTWPESEMETVSRFMRVEGPPKPVTSLEERVERLIESVDRRCSLIEYMLQNREWDLFYAVVPEPDWVFHFLYTEILEKRGVGARALRIFERIDRLIRFIHENAPENTLLIMCSDHGFMEAHTSLNVNVLLQKLGLLKTRISRLPLRARIVHAIARYIPPSIRERIKYGHAFTLAQRLQVVDLLFHTGRIPIDYAKSLAYATISYNLYVNPGLEGEERRRVVETVLRALSEYRDMFEVLDLGQNVFRGPFSDRAPTIFMVPKRGFNVSTRLFYRNVVERGRWYVHSSRGFIAMTLLDGYELEVTHRESVRNVDIAPTALAWISAALDPDMDGAPLIRVEKPRYRRYQALFRSLKRMKLSSSA